MVRTAFVYVPSDSAENLRIGLDHNVWGWEDSVLSRAGVHSVAASLQPSDLLVLGFYGPNPRVKPGLWADATVRSAHVMQVTRPLYRVPVRLWPDKDYPERVDLAFLTDYKNAGSGVFGEGGMEALRLSGNKQGAPVLSVDRTLVDLLEADVAAEPDDADSDFEQEMNGLILAVRRKEHAKLKKLKFGARTEITCDLCGRTVPRRIVRAAHIKRRSECHYPEHLDVNNIMAACTLGCDELFEHGFVYVDSAGVIQLSDRCRASTELTTFAERDLATRRCAAHGPYSESYFAYHRSHFLTP
jgi:hypothetical protein